MTLNFQEKTKIFASFVVTGLFMICTAGSFAQMTTPLAVNEDTTNTSTLTVTNGSGTLNVAENKSFIQEGATSGSGTLTLNGPGTVFFNGSGSVYSGPYNIQNGTLKFYLATAVASRTITGAGILDISGTADISLNKWNITDFDGTINLQNVRLSEPTFTAATDATVNIAAGSQFYYTSGSTENMTFNIAGTGISDNYGAIRVHNTALSGTINLTDDALISKYGGTGMAQIDGATINLQEHTLTLNADVSNSTIHAGNGKLALTGGTSNGSSLNNTTIQTAAGTTAKVESVSKNNYITANNSSDGAYDYSNQEWTANGHLNLTIAKAGDTTAKTSVTLGTLNSQTYETPAAPSYAPAYTPTERYFKFSGGNIVNQGANEIELQVGALNYSDDLDALPTTLQATFGGGISGNVSLTKIGSGTQVLGSSVLSYTGKTSVESGELRFYNTSLTTTSGIDIAEGATLNIYHAYNRDIKLGSSDPLHPIPLTGNGTLKFTGDGFVSTNTGDKSMSILNNVDMENFEGDVLVDGARLAITQKALTDREVRATILDHSQLYVTSADNVNPANARVNIAIAGEGVWDPFKQVYLGAIRLQSPGYGNGEVEDTTFIYGKVNLTDDASVCAYNSAGAFATDFDLNGHKLSFGGYVSTEGELDPETAVITGHSGKLYLSGAVTSTETLLSGEEYHIYKGSVRVGQNIHLSDTLVGEDLVSFHDGSQARWSIEQDLYVETSSEAVSLGSLDGSGKIITAPVLKDGVNTRPNLELKLGGTNIDNPLAFDGLINEQTGANKTVVSITKDGKGTQNLGNGDSTYQYTYTGVTSLVEGRLNIAGQLQNSLILIDGVFSAGNATGKIGVSSVGIGNEASLLEIGTDNTDTVSEMVVDIALTDGEAVSDLVITENLKFSDYAKNNFKISLNELTTFNPNEEYKSAIIMVENGFNDAYASNNFWEKFLNGENKPFWSMLVEGNTVYAVHNASYPVPEPGTLILLGIGMILICGMRKRSRNA